MGQAVIESGRAEFALEAVKKVVDTENDQTRKEYRIYIKKFPLLALSNGLAAAVAFAQDKGGTWGIVYDNIANWLIKNGYFAKPTRLLDYVCSLDSDTYRVVTNETLALFGWLCRLAGGLIEGAEDE
ncbi:MAG: type III-B CRISPR module-associated protein Cmr5 [Peptococcaceae bacterium]|jgi:CRISPR-associated protein Cmr5|nr:type III-B CRISPR module-associated protein Cmr5 [Peptococcaceae bacterium]